MFEGNSFQILEVMTEKAPQPCEKRKSEGKEMRGVL